MRWIVYVVAALVVVIVLVAVVGAMLPRKHRVSRTVQLPLPPDALYAILTDVSHYPSWRPDVKSLQRLPDKNGMPAWVEETGGMRIPMTFEHMEPRLLIGRIDSTELAFGGTWTYRLEALPGGDTALTITEDGEVSNVIFRFMSKFVFGHDATMDGFIRNLQARASK